MELHGHLVGGWERCGLQRRGTARLDSRFQSKCNTRIKGSMAPTKLEHDQAMTMIAESHGHRCETAHRRGNERMRHDPRWLEQWPRHGMGSYWDAWSRCALPRHGAAWFGAGSSRAPTHGTPRGCSLVEVFRKGKCRRRYTGKTLSGAVRGDSRCNSKFVVQANRRKHCADNT